MTAPSGAPPANTGCAIPKRTRPSRSTWALTKRGFRAADFLGAQAVGYAVAARAQIRVPQAYNFVRVILFQVAGKDQVPAAEFFFLLFIGRRVQQAPHRFKTGNKGDVGHAFRDNAFDLFPL